MANKHLFDTRAAATPQADTYNEAGGKAYAFTPKHALAQYAMTGCLNTTFYVDAQQQLDKVLELCQGLDPEFIGKVAIYARQKGYMKDMPALLCAVLAVKDVDVLKQVFPVVIDNGKMLRNFVQIIRSGAVGRKSFGRAVKRLILTWLADRSDDQLFRQSIGNDPSFPDILKMVHPTPADKNREALYGYLLGKEKVNQRYLPALVKQYEKFKTGKSKVVPDVPFQFLASLDIGTDVWTEIAKNASWQTVRMNLNTFARHGVLESGEMVKLLAARLRDEKEIQRARVFPYQLLAAYLNTEDSSVPRELRNALQDAMEIAVNNVPVIDGKVYVFPDVSGSMSSPVTGARKGATSKVRCVDVAALVAASVLRRNPNAEVIPFETCVVPLQLNPRDSIMTNAQKLASVGGGGTNCSAPLQLLNQQKAKGDVCIYVSDNESWQDASRYYGGTGLMAEWQKFKKRNRARLVCIDIQVSATTQAPDRGTDVLNIGGFSDQVFNLIGDFVGDGLGTSKWVNTIEKVDLQKKLDKDAD